LLNEETVQTKAVLDVAIQDSTGGNGHWDLCQENEMYTGTCLHPGLYPNNAQNWNQKEMNTLKNIINKNFPTQPQMHFTVTYTAFVSL